MFFRCQSFPVSLWMRQKIFFNAGHLSRRKQRYWNDLCWIQSFPFVLPNPCCCQVSCTLFFQASYFLRRQLVWNSDLRQPFLFNFFKFSFQWEVTERSGKACSVMFDSRTFIGCLTHCPFRLRQRGENHPIIHFLFVPCFFIWRGGH